ncbi:MAG TPA: PAS domain-containing protein, partial [Gammaproteobacteria bacterium]|nr:PAS domain-containing protein [Gammaproteobacteria bacterium]
DMVQAANPAFEQIFGWRTDDVLGRVSAAIVDFPAGPALSSGLPGPGEAGLDCEAAITHADGRRLLERATLSAFTDTTGERSIVLVLQTTPRSLGLRTHRSRHAASESSGASH